MHADAVAYKSNGKNHIFDTYFRVPKYTCNENNPPDCTYQKEMKYAYNPIGTKILARALWNKAGFDIAANGT